MLSVIVPEICGNNEMVDELIGELGFDKSVSPYELAGAEFVLVWLGPGREAGGGPAGGPAGWPGVTRLSGGGVTAVRFLPLRGAIVRDKVARFVLNS